MTDPVPLLYDGSRAVPGSYWRDNLSDAEYDAIDAIRSSDLRHLLQSPMHYASRATLRKETSALALGTAVDLLVLRPELAARVLHPQPEEINRRTKQGRLEWDAWLASLPPGAITMKAEAYNVARSAAKAVLDYGPAIELLSDGVAQRTVVAPYRGEHALMLRKARPDYLHSAGIIIDLKTSRDASERGFAAAIGRYGYHMQGAYYRDVCQSAGLRASHVAWIVVETSPPYACGAYVLSEDDMEYGEEAWRRALAVYERASAARTWSGYTQHIRTIALPGWAKQHYAFEELSDEETD